MFRSFFIFKLSSINLITYHPKIEETGCNIISAVSRNHVLGTDCFLHRLPFFTIRICFFILFLRTGNNQHSLPAGY